MVVRRLFTPEEDATIIRLRRLHTVYEHIGFELGRSASCVCERGKWLGLRRDGTVDEEAAVRWRASRRERPSNARIRDRKPRRKGGGIRDMSRKPRMEDIPADCLPPADTRDITAFHFGDPLPGRSALDQLSAR